ncbi:hypothetical protein COLO4_00623, partial [Corchorus olitorius]
MRNQNPLTASGIGPRAQSECPQGEDAAQMGNAIVNLEPGLAPALAALPHHQAGLVVQLGKGPGDPHLHGEIRAGGITPEMSAVTFEAVLGLLPEVGLAIGADMQQAVRIGPARRLVQPMGRQGLRKGHDRYPRRMGCAHDRSRMPDAPKPDGKSYCEDREQSAERCARGHYLPSSDFLAGMKKGSPEAPLFKYVCCPLVFVVGRRRHRSLVRPTNEVGSEQITLVALERSKMI